MRVSKLHLNLSFLVALSIVTVAHASSVSARTTSWPQVEKALSTIKTVTGHSALSRLRSCGIKIDRRRSSLKRVDDQDWVYVAVTMPPRDEDRFFISFGWVLKGGVATPTSLWGQKLQFNAAPLGSSTWLNC